MRLRAHVEKGVRKMAKIPCGVSIDRKTGEESVLWSEVTEADLARIVLALAGLDPDEMQEAI